MYVQRQTHILSTTENDKAVRIINEILLQKKTVLMLLVTNFQSDANVLQENSTSSSKQIRAARIFGSSVIRV